MRGPTQGTTDSERPEGVDQGTVRHGTVRSASMHCRVAGSTGASLSAGGMAQQRHGSSKVRYGTVQWGTGREELVHVLSGSVASMGRLAHSRPCTSQAHGVRRPQSPPVHQRATAASLMCESFNTCTALRACTTWAAPFCHIPVTTATTSNANKPVQATHRQALRTRCHAEGNSSARVSCQISSTLAHNG